MAKSSQISGLTSCETTRNLATAMLLEGKLRLTDSRIISFLTWKVNNVKKNDQRSMSKMQVLLTVGSSEFRSSHMVNDLILSDY